MKEQLEAIRKQALEAVAGTQASADLEAVRVQYLGKKGELTAVLKQMGKLSPEERPVMGQLANEVRAAVEAAIEAQSAVLAEKALAAKLDKKDYRVYTLLGDGECEEGQVWEAAMFAGHKKLDNLCVIVDYNGLQIDGPVSQVAGPEPLDKKFEAFNFETITINGNDFDEIERAMDFARSVKGKPCAIIAKTEKGKGVSFMTNAVEWHGKGPNKQEYDIAMAELNAKLAELEA